MNLTAARQGRIRKALDKRFTFDDGVATLGARIRRYTWHRKDSWMQERHFKEKRLEKPKLKRPKTWYTIWRWRDGKETGLTVPKIVWEHLEEIPEAEHKPCDVVVSTYDPLRMDTVCPVCGGPVDWTFDNFSYGPSRLECLDVPEHTPRDLDVFNNLGPEPPDC